MPLPTTYTTTHGAIGDFFAKIRDGQAPEKFTLQLLKDIGYPSSNHRPFIPLMKSLGFLTADGTPTQRYHNYRNHAISKKVMGEAIKDAYSDIFLIKSKPTQSDKALIEGKFKSYHNVSDAVASLMAKTFYALLNLADLDIDEKSEKNEKNTEKTQIQSNLGSSSTGNDVHLKDFGLHYNIQIHLPATKDVEVYNAIFKSLKEHLIE